MTKKAKYRIGSIQTAITIFVWVLLFATPVLFGDFDRGVDWDHIFHIWKEYGVVFGIYLLNHFLLLPKLFFQGRRVLYFSTIATMILTFVLITYYNNEYQRKLNRPEPMTERFEARPERPERPERFDGSGGPDRRGEPSGPPMNMPPPHLRSNPPKEMIPSYANMLVLCVLLIGFDTGLVFSIKWIKSEQSKVSLQKENVENKMAFLQNQISPHFFMNTLNNIHALVDIDTEEAKEAIIELSRLMGYMLYESQIDRIPIEKEINFVKSYVELMKLRFSDEVRVTVEIPSVLPSITVPPLLTISYIENAFKHGISYQENSYVNIKYSFTNYRMIFRVENTIHTAVGKTENSGIGMQNAKNRLDLIYHNEYNLSVEEKADNIFAVNLNVPI